MTASSRRRGSRQGARPRRRGRAGSTGPEANSGIEAGDIDVVLTVANCEAEEGGRLLNHFVGAIIQRKESQPEPVPTDKNVLRLPKRRRKMYFARGGRGAMDQRRPNKGVH